MDKKNINMYKCDICVLQITDLLSFLFTFIKHFKHLFSTLIIPYFNSFFIIFFKKQSLFRDFVYSLNRPFLKIKKGRFLSCH